MAELILNSGIFSIEMRPGRSGYSGISVVLRPAETHLFKYPKVSLGRNLAEQQGQPAHRKHHIKDKRTKVVIVQPFYNIRLVICTSLNSNNGHTGKDSLSIIPAYSSMVEAELNR